MYVDFQDDWPRPEPWKPERPKRRFTKRQENVVIWIVAFNMLMLLLAPVAGGTVFDAVVALVRH
jgi:hypothetical protein